MKFTPVDHVPEPKRAYNKLQKLIDDFVKSPHEVVKCHFEEGEYASSSVCYSVLRLAAKRSRHGVKVLKRGNDIYLSK